MMELAMLTLPILVNAAVGTPAVEVKSSGVNVLLLLLILMTELDWLVA